MFSPMIIGSFLPCANTIAKDTPKIIDAMDVQKSFMLFGYVSALISDLGLRLIKPSLTVGLPPRFDVFR
jgi:hypothetical protein